MACSGALSQAAVLWVQQEAVPHTKSSTSLTVAPGLIFGGFSSKTWLDVN